MSDLSILTDHPDAFLLLIALLSLLVGSFLNVVIFRLPRMIQQEWGQECRHYLGLKSTAETERLNLWLPRSHCPACKKVIKPWHNIPLVSYLILRGQCVNCKTTIPLRYPLVELLCCFASVYVAWRFGVTAQTAGALIFTWILIALTFIDVEHQLLPDQLTLLLLWIGLVLSLFSVFVPSSDAIIGAILGYLIFATIQALFQFATGKRGMGQGDYKLLAALGAYLGWHELPLIILLASTIGIVMGILHMVMKRRIASVALPFGPYLAFAGWVALLWGRDIMQLYLHYFF